MAKVGPALFRNFTRREGVTQTQSQAIYHSNQRNMPPKTTPSPPPSPCAMIPARFASKRLPGKPLLNIGSMSLIERAYRNAVAMDLFGEIFILTDDKRIQKHVQGFGGRVLMTSATCANGTHRIAQALQEHEALVRAPIIVNLQGDEPFMPKEAVAATLQMLQRYPQANIATCAVPVKEGDFDLNSVVKCVFTLSGDALYFSRASIPGKRSDAPTKGVKRLFRYRHLGIYAYRRAFLPIYAQLADTPLQLLEDLEQLKILEHGFHIKIASCDLDCPLGVDTEADLQRVREHVIASEPAG